MFLICRKIKSISWCKKISIVILASIVVTTLEELNVYNCWNVVTIITIKMRTLVHVDEFLRMLFVQHFLHLISSIQRQFLFSSAVSHSSFKAYFKRSRLFTGLVYPGVPATLTCIGVILSRMKMLYYLLSVTQFIYQGEWHANFRTAS